MKYKYTARYEGEVIGTRTSHRTYTHAVIVQDDEDLYRQYAYNYALTQSDLKNFDYYCDMAKRQPGDPHRIYGKYTAEQIAEAKAMTAGGLDSYADKQRQHKIAQFETWLKKGGAKPRVATWCGSLALANKAARNSANVGKRNSGFTHLRAIVPAEAEVS